jgi:hypothetical protein
VVDEVVVAAVKGFVLIDPMEETEMVANRCGCQRPHLGAFEHEIVYRAKCQC